MPSVLPTGRRSAASPNSRGAQDDGNDSFLRVHPSQADENALAEIHRTLTGRSEPEPQSTYPEPHSSFDKFLKQENRAREDSGLPLGGLGVSFRNVTTWGEGDGHSDVKTLTDAVWRTFTLQDIWEWTLKRWVAPPKLQDGRPLIKDFSGVVRRGEIMLVLGRPGSGCSTFLRTVANNHSPFLGVTGSINYSGLDSAEISKHYRGEVAYIPEEDVHFPTLTVRQTLEFALQAKTPKRYRHHIPRMLEMYGRVFGISHVMDTLVGNEYIRGISGGERKRLSIIESLSADSSVVSWDNSTRGLDAVAAVDYARSLRIMTDACGKATIVALYQASEAVYELADKVLLIDDGRMIYQGPANKARQYFEDLGYERAERQTTADFLTSITLPGERKFRDGWEAKAPKGAIELEEAFRKSDAFKDVENDISRYEKQSQALSEPAPDQNMGFRRSSLEDFKSSMRGKKSRFVSPKSSYNTSFSRQVFLCTKRQWWQLKGHLAPLYTKVISALISALLIGSQFYDQPDSTDGVFSRGGFLFYSAIIIAWLQMAELEEAVQGRDILSRQKRTAFVRPSAVQIARVFIDIIVVLLETVVYTIISYFLAGMKTEPGPFFIYVLFLYTCSLALTAQFRLFGAISPSFEMAIRYAGVSVLICIIYGGYVLSVGRLISDVPWVGWLAYATPALYTYEAVMAAEFHGKNFTCAQSSIIPFGPEYTDVQYQSCAYAGSKPGSLVLNGDDYLAAQFDFYYGNVWRNFGILILFTVAFVLLSAWFSEVIEWDTGSAGPMQYKKKWPKLSKVVKKGNDEEKSAVQADHQAPPAHRSGVLATGNSTAQGLMKTRSVFAWENLRYTIQSGKEEKVLLNDTTGYCKPGQMTALVGSSGAGKSTLMTILTNRQNIGQLSGNILIDGNPIDSSFDRKIGYCQQMDIHDESATIREAFEFSALLRQSADTPQQEKLAYVNTVLEILELSDVQDAIIGSLQLEQKKRVTIGVELSAKPELLLFLDEPTSGLDSQSALGIVSLLRKLADSGQAILCTIHQANQQQIELFDRVLALNPGGNTYYFGDVGHHGSSIFKYFSSHGVPVSPNKNAADFLIEVGAGAIEPETNPDTDWSDVWKNSPEAQSVSEYLTDLRTTAKPQSQSSVTTYSSPTSLQIRLLAKRTLRQYYRTPEYPYSRLYGSVIHSLLNGLTYLSAGSSLTTTSLQSKSFSCFLVLMLVPEFINATSMRFITNRSLFLARESPSRTYTWPAFCTSQILPELPFALIGGILFYIIYYFLVSLPLGAAAGYTFFMTLLFHLFATSWGQWIAAMSPDSIIAANLMPLFVIMCELFNGILRPHEQMAVVWKYSMYYMSPFTYWIGGVLSIVLSGQPVRCDESELSFFNSPPGMSCGEYASSWLNATSGGVPGYLSNPDSTGGECGYCEYSVADDYLSTLDLHPSKIWKYMGIFIGFTITNYLMVYLMFWLVSVKRIFGKERGG